VAHGKAVQKCPHWGFVLSGQLTVTYADRSQEIVKAQDLFCWPQGHNVKVDQAAEIVMFSPQHEHTHVLNHMIAKVSGAPSQAS
jgi:mannose-6-phosphate isomerase-like protein (cupin superfamily)